MPVATLETLIEAGAHFGHRTSRWNPKMKPFIFGKRNHIHIIDLRETLKGLIRASHFLKEMAGAGHEILFVGTKRQARETVQAAATRAEMHFIVDRWPGGLLTNYTTVYRRLKRLEELETLFASGVLATGSRKKMMSTLMREKKKIERNLRGVRKMTKIPGVLIIVDPLREKNAVKEARKLGIPTVALIDTDCNPEIVDIAIPGNDDAFRSIECIVNSLATAVQEGTSRFKAAQAIAQKKDETEPKAPAAQAPAAVAPAAPVPAAVAPKKE